MSECEYNAFLTRGNYEINAIMIEAYPAVDEKHGRRHGGSRVGKRPPWKKSGWAWPTLEILAVV